MKSSFFTELQYSTNASNIFKNVFSRLQYQIMFNGFCVEYYKIHVAVSKNYDIICEPSDIGGILGMRVVSSKVEL